MAGATGSVGGSGGGGGAAGGDERVRVACRVRPRLAHQRIGDGEFQVRPCSSASV
jgi:hypothetical protein